MSASARIVRQVLIATVLCGLLIAASVAFVDRPVARYAHDHIGPQRFLSLLQRIPELVAVPALPVALVLALVWLVRGGLRGLAKTLFVAAVSVLIADAAKDHLKLAFGRTWPETWTANNPSWINNGVFGFFPFHGGMGWASFPSGHVTVIAAAMGVFWARWPRLWPIWTLPVIATAIGLLGMDYHFVGDIIAGAAVGAAVAFLATGIAGRRA